MADRKLSRPDMMLRALDVLDQWTDAFLRRDFSRCSECKAKFEELTADG